MLGVGGEVRRELRRKQRQLVVLLEEREGVVVHREQAVDLGAAGQEENRARAEARGEREDIVTNKVFHRLDEARPCCAPPHRQYVSCHRTKAPASMSRCGGGWTVSDEQESRNTHSARSSAIHCTESWGRVMSAPLARHASSPRSASPARVRDQIEYAGRSNHAQRAAGCTRNGNVPGFFTGASSRAMWHSVQKRSSLATADRYGSSAAG